MGDLARRHEFDAGPERIAQRQTEIGSLGPRQDFSARDGWGLGHRLGYSTRMSSSRTTY